MFKPQSLVTIQLHHHHLPLNVKSSLMSSKKLMSLVLFLPYILLNAIWINNLPPLTPHYPTTWPNLRIMLTIVLVAFFSKNKPLLSMSTSLGLSISSLGLLQQHHYHNTPTLNQTLPLQTHHHQTLQTLQISFPQKFISIKPSTMFPISKPVLENSSWKLHIIFCSLPRKAYMYAYVPMIMF